MILKAEPDIEVVGEAGDGREAVDEACEIVAELVVSEHTTKTHVASILQKLDLRNRVQAVVFAYETGLVKPGS
jgi:DNA-binding NarL/FixJ family response regulator